MNVDRGFEQQRRQDHVENEIMSQHRAGLKARDRETDPRDNEPDRVGKRKAAREHCDKDCDAEQADRMAESNIHQRIIAARQGIDATMPVLTPESKWIAARVPLDRSKYIFNQGVAADSITINPMPDMADHPIPHSPDVALICCAVGAIQL